MLSKNIQQLLKKLFFIEIKRPTLWSWKTNTVFGLTVIMSHVKFCIEIDTKCTYKFCIKHLTYDNKYKYNDDSA
jgi:hypothetical protein